MGDKDTTLSSHFQISGSAQISPGWSAGYTIAVETRGGSARLVDDNQFNDNVAMATSHLGNINTLLSYMWIKSDTYGTINWGQLSQATDNVALLPDLSGTVIEANAVLFDGAGMFVRPKGAKNSNDLASDFTWGAVVDLLTAGGGGIGADCNGYPDNAFRYDTPTWAGFSVSTSYGEDDMWDVAVKYAADWNSVKFSAAAGYTQLTDEGCFAVGVASAGACTNLALLGGGGTPFQNFRRDAPTLPGRRVRHARSIRPVRLWLVSERAERRHAVARRPCNFNTGQACRQRSQRDRRLVREGRYQESLDASWRHRALRRVGPV